MNCQEFNPRSSEEWLPALQRDGYVILAVPQHITELSTAVFDCFAEFNQRSDEDKAKFSLVPHDEGDNNGWHPCGGLSKYNQCREGYIFQATSAIWPMLSTNRDCPPDAFSTIHQHWRQEVYVFVTSLLTDLATYLDIPHPASFFSSNGTFDVISASQFHIKNTPVMTQIETNEHMPSTTSAGHFITLPAHRDPTLISIVLHNCHARGLEMQWPLEGTSLGYREVYTHDTPPGPERCVVIVGTLLERLSGGFFRAPYHRVVSIASQQREETRLAATFFFQPTLDSILAPFPSTSIRTDTPNNTQVLCYRDWKRRAYGKYYKSSANKEKHRDNSVQVK